LLGQTIPQRRHFPDQAELPTLQDTAIEHKPLTVGPFGQVGPYLLKRLIGRGGMGMVYEGLHTRLGRSFAVKVISRPAAQDPEYLARFEREIRAVGKLHHENIVAATDAGDHDGVPYLAMELISGYDLARILRNVKSLSLSDICSLMHQAASGLASAHALGIVHRDVKPSNFILAPNGQLKVLDLGLALFVNQAALTDEAITQQSILGTTDYISPEQWSDSGRVTGQADVYSLGCMAYQFLTGQVPFAAAKLVSHQAIRDAHMHTPPVPIVEMNADIPQAVSELVQRMLAKLPENRPTMAQCARRFKELQPGTERLKHLVERVQHGIAGRDSETVDTVVFQSHQLELQNESAGGQTQSFPRSDVSNNGTEGDALMKQWLVFLGLVLVVLACTALLLWWVKLR
jgi:serine/threonine protein kinase